VSRILADLAMALARAIRLSSCGYNAVLWLTALCRDFYLKKKEKG
jgi:hypothetical protein